MLHKTSILGVTAALALTACATEPAVVSTQYQRPLTQTWPKPAPSKAGAAQVACKVRLTDVRDLRADPTSMGSIGWRPVHAEDSPAWVRQSLESLAQDPRITLVGASDPADVDLSADILKAYIHSQTQVKSATVVLRVHYSHGGSLPTEQTYRGASDGLNWAGGEGEARGALNKALSRALDGVHDDLVGFCQAVLTP